MQSTKHYGLLTAITMIVGIVIGSGIFFKAPSVLIATKGSITLGVLCFAFAALNIIFGSLALSELAKRTTRSGGLITYFEEFVSKKTAAGIGWFMLFFYLPAINAVVSWVVGMFLYDFLGLSFEPEKAQLFQVLLGFVVITIVIFTNYLSYRFGGFIQNSTTFIKLIPMAFIAVLGFITPHASPVETVKSISTGGLGFLSALAPVAFSYDGWHLALGISHEVKDAERNMPKALTVGPLIVLIFYVLYFVGFTKLLGVETILQYGNSSLSKAGEMLFGPLGSKVFLFFIIISVLGVVNGISMGSIRIPQALSEKGMLPSGSLQKMDSKRELSLASTLLFYGLSVFMLLLHYLTMRYKFLGNNDLSEVAIAFEYACFIILFIYMLKMYKRGEIKSRFKGLVCPMLGILGSCIILYGSISPNPLHAMIYMLFCFVVFLFGVFYYKKRNH
ncbi:APC family permease [Guggenheimella bovis]